MRSRHEIGDGERDGNLAQRDGSATVRIPHRARAFKTKNGQPADVREWLSDRLNALCTREEFEEVRSVRVGGHIDARDDDSK